MKLIVSQVFSAHCRFVVAYNRLNKCHCAVLHEFAYCPNLCLLDTQFQLENNITLIKFRTEIKWHLIQEVGGVDERREGRGGEGGGDIRTCDT